MIGDSITDRDRRDILFELDDLPIPYMVNLSVFSTLNHADLEAHILRVGQIFYERGRVEEPPKSGIPVP